MADPTIIIAGLGRCGSTMVMRMLAAAGVPTIGTAPDWECMESTRLIEDDPQGWVSAVRGKAVKVLDAHRYTIPQLGPARMIWLHRDARQQARSMIRFLNLAFSMVKEDRNSVRQMGKSILRDTPTAIRRLQHANPSMGGIALQFERILAAPESQAAVICQHIGIPLDRAPIMASQVMRHQPECLAKPMEAYLV